MVHCIIVFILQKRVDDADWRWIIIYWVFGLTAALLAEVSAAPLAADHLDALKASST